MAWVCSPYKPVKAEVMEEMCIKDKKNNNEGKKYYEKMFRIEIDPQQIEAKRKERRMNTSWYLQ